MREAFWMLIAFVTTVSGAWFALQWWKATRLVKQLSGPWPRFTLDLFQRLLNEGRQRFKGTFDQKQVIWSTKWIIDRLRLVDGVLVDVGEQRLSLHTGIEVALTRQDGFVHACVDTRLSREALRSHSVAASREVVEACQMSNGIGHLEETSRLWESIQVRV